MISSISLKKSVFSPLFLYFTIWALMLFFYSIKFLDYGSLSKSFWIAISLNILGLLLGYNLAIVITPNFRLQTSRINIWMFNNYLNSKSKRIRIIYYVCCAMGVIGVILMYIVVFSQINLTEFFTQQATVKAVVDRSLVGTYLSAGAYVAIPLGVIIKSLMRRSWIYPIFPLIICFLFSFSFWGRLPFVQALIIFASSKILISLLSISLTNFRCYTRKFIMKWVIIISISIILIFVFLSWTIHFRISQYGPRFNPVAKYTTDNLIAEFFNKHSSIFASYRAAQITWSYLIAPIATFNYWVSQDSEYALGQASFPYFFRLVHKIGLSEEPKIVGDRPLGGGLQLPTFLGYAYIDFGYIGILIYSFILGLIPTAVYKKLFIRPRLSSYMYLSLIYVLILLSPMTFAPYMTLFPIILFYMWGVNIIIRLRLPFIKKSRKLS